jgi:hypothetical protein
MIEFSCPNCGTNVKAPNDKIGARSKCPRCKAPVQVPDPDVAHPNMVPVQRTSAYYQFSQPAPPPSFPGWEALDIFDFRFKRYLTPYLIRAMWAILVILSIVGFLVVLFKPVIDAKRPTAAAIAADRAADRAAFERPGSIPAKRSEPNPLAEWWSSNWMYLSLCIAGLISARISAELVIVIFNISNDLNEAKRRYEEVHAAR